jgi:hypothetical protein
VSSSSFLIYSGGAKLLSWHHAMGRLPHSVTHDRLSPSAFLERTSSRISLEYQAAARLLDYDSNQAASALMHTDKRRANLPMILGKPSCH